MCWSRDPKSHRGRLHQFVGKVLAHRCASVSSSEFHKWVPASSGGSKSSRHWGRRSASVATRRWVTRGQLAGGHRLTLYYCIGEMLPVPLICCSVNHSLNIPLYKLSCINLSIFGDVACELSLQIRCEFANVHWLPPLKSHSPVWACRVFAPSRIHLFIVVSHVSLRNLQREEIEILLESITISSKFRNSLIQWLFNFPRTVLVLSWTWTLTLQPSVRSCSHLQAKQYYGHSDKH